MEGGLRQTSLVICFINFLDERNLDVLSHVSSHQMGVLQIFFCRFVEGLQGLEQWPMGRSKGSEWPGHVRVSLLIILLQAFLSSLPLSLGGEAPPFRSVTGQSFVKNTLCQEMCPFHASFMGYYHCGGKEIEANKNEVGAGDMLWAGGKTPEVCAT